jgi:hypothetical protein
VRRALLGLAAVVVAGCGTPSADLFVVERSGAIPDAKLDLVVGDGGAVQCDGTERSITSAQLLEARELARDLAPLLDRGVDLRPQAQSILRFKVIGEQGTARFSDSSKPLPPELARVIAFTREVARGACGRER